MTRRAPKFRKAHASYYLVRDRDVSRGTKRESVREFLAKANAGGSDGEELSEEELDRLADGIASGALRLVRVQRKPPPLEAPKVQNLADLAPTEPTSTIEAPQPVGFALIDYSGVPYAKAQVHVTFPDGREASVRLDDQGRWQEDAVRGPGKLDVRFAEPLELPPLDERAATRERSTSHSAKHLIDRKTPGRVRLSLGKVHEIVVRPPPPQPARAFPGSTFAFDASFPTPSVASLIKAAHELLDSTPEASVGIFGHADKSGSEEYNKTLSDARAELVFSLLTGDFERFASKARDEDWAPEHYQVMLRALGNNPGAIDGQVGPQTKQAVAAFRHDYNLDLFHDDGRRARACPDLPEGDALDDATKDALVDAYHAELSGDLDPARFVGPKFSGCGEFNPRSDEPAENRRVTLAIYGADAPEAREFPCIAGEASACEVDDGGRARCRFYRERVAPEEARQPALPFWDLRWLPTLTGYAQLSALTTLPDTDDVEFVVQLAQGVSATEETGEGTSLPATGTEIARIPGVIRQGVAHTRWDPGDYDPFDPRRWFEDPTFELGPRVHLPEYQPPVFGIVGPGAWALSAPPGQRFEHLRSSEPLEGAAVALRSDGALLLILDAANPDPTESLDIIALHRAGFFPKDPQDEGEA